MLDFRHLTHHLEACLHIKNETKDTKERQHSQKTISKDTQEMPQSQSMASVAQLDALSDWRPEDCEFKPPPRSATFFSTVIPFRWFKKGSCQFLAKECAKYWLKA